MATKLAVTVAVDMDVTAVTLKPAGALTSDNVRGLIAVAHRAQRVLTDFTVRVDLGRLHAVTPGALRELADAGLESLLPPVRDVRGSRNSRPLLRLAA